MVPTQSQSEIISTSTQALLELATLQAVKLLAVNIKNCTYNNKLGPGKKQETNSHRYMNFTSQQGHRQQGHTYQMSSSITVLIMVNVITVSETICDEDEVCVGLSSCEAVQAGTGGCQVGTRLASLSCPLLAAWPGQPPPDTSALYTQ